MLAINNRATKAPSTSVDDNFTPEVNDARVFILRVRK